MIKIPNIFQDVSKKIADNITVDSTKKIQFRDSGLYLNSSADGQLDVVADTTVALSGAVTADSTVVATSTVQASAFKLAAENFTASGVAGTAQTTTGYITITPGGAGTSTTVNIAAPVPNQFLVITQVGAGTAIAQLLAGDFDGSNNTATFNAAEETLVLFGVNATRYVIVENIGSVAFS